MIANAGSDASRVLADALRRLHQQLVAGGVSQRVVNFLESVKVKEQHRLI